MSSASATELDRDVLPAVSSGDPRVVDLLRDLVIKGVTAIVDEHHRLTEVCSGLRTSLTSAREQLDRAHFALVTRDEVTTDVAHDLRSPLSAIAASTDLIEDVLANGTVDRASISERFAVIRRSTRRMERMIEDLLDSARLDQSKLTLSLAMESTELLVRRAVEEALPAARAKSIELEVALVDGQVRCDHDRIQQVLSNIVGNAIKYTPRGGNVLVGTEPLGRDHHFFVIDDGPGIAAGHMANLFERFWQAGVDGSGLGLGLAIAKGIVETHGGRIWADDNARAGAAFHFTLPA